eukprot:gene9731-biopygen12331
MQAEGGAAVEAAVERVAGLDVEGADPVRAPRGAQLAVPVRRPHRQAEPPPCAGQGGLRQSRRRAGVVGLPARQPVGALVQPGVADGEHRVEPLQPPRGEVEPPRPRRADRRPVPRLAARPRRRLRAPPRRGRVAVPGEGGVGAPPRLSHRAGLLEEHRVTRHHSKKKRAAATASTPHPPRAAACYGNCCGCSRSRRSRRSRRGRRGGCSRGCGCGCRCPATPPPPSVRYYSVTPLPGIVFLRRALRRRPLSDSFTSTSFQLMECRRGTAERQTRARTSRGRANCLPPSVE